MGIRTVLQNIKKHGIVKTLKIRKRHRAELAEVAKNEDEFLKLSEPYIRAYETRDFSETGLTQLKTLEDKMRSGYPYNYKKLFKKMKALYVKERIPEAYNEAVKEDVRDKVIFCENGFSPSPSNRHLSDVLTAQGKYEVKHTSLKIRAVSDIEYFERAIDFIRDMATAKAVFLTSASDIMCYIDVRPETKVIQLWHGLAALKYIGYSTLGKGFGKNIDDRMEYDQYKNYTYVTVPSKGLAFVYEDAMHLTLESGVLQPVGMARTDQFYDVEQIEKDRETLYEAYPQIRGKKIILYIPTFRGNVVNAYAPKLPDIGKFAEALSDEYVLLVKQHGIVKEMPELPEKYLDSFVFDMNRNEVLGIDSLLSIADIYITDYSSLIFECSIMERPMIFYAYDLDEYIDERGMYFEYDDVTPGPICKTDEEMIDHILHIDERFDKQVMIDFKKKYVDACDGHATERTIALLEGKPM